jgi:hypothetical protein
MFILHTHNHLLDYMVSEQDGNFNLPHLNLKSKITPVCAEQSTWQIQITVAALQKTMYDFPVHITLTGYTNNG